MMRRHLLAALWPRRWRGQTGMASWYDQGRITASGERFNPHALTAAHRSLPFGTRLLVRRTDTHAHVVVRVNDRGPYRWGRIVDLTPAAASRIGIHHRGLAHVHLSILK